MTHMISPASLTYSDDEITPVERDKKLRAVLACLTYLTDEVRGLGETTLDQELNRTMDTVSILLQRAKVLCH